MNEKMARLLGMCRGAGGCLCGASAVELAIKRGKCYLVLIAADCGGSTRDKFIHLCEAAKIDYLISAGKLELGRAVGYKEKAVVGVADKSFAAGIAACMPN